MDYLRTHLSRMLDGSNETKLLSRELPRTRGRRLYPNNFEEHAMDNTILRNPVFFQLQKDASASWILACQTPGPRCQDAEKGGRGFDEARCGFWTAVQGNLQGQGL